MKKQILLIALLITTCFWQSANAQVGVHVNIGVQPVWGPVGYDYVNYYYLPDLDAYYDVPNQQYMFFEGGRWVPMRTLPPRYRGFDLYGAHKVVINDPNPWMHHDRYRTQYASFRGHHDQQVIRDSHEDRYRENPHHPEHNQWHGDRGHDGGRGHDDHGGERGHDEHGGERGR